MVHKPCSQKISPSLHGLAPGHSDILRPCQTKSLPGPGDATVPPHTAQSHFCSQEAQPCHASLCFGWFPAASLSGIPVLCRPGASRTLHPASWGEGPLVTLPGGLFSPTVVWPISRGGWCAAVCVGAAALLCLSRVLHSSSLCLGPCPGCGPRLQDSFCLLCGSISRAV